MLFLKSQEKDHSKKLVLDGRIILKWMLDNRAGIDFIHLAQDTGHWRALVNTVNFGLHKTRGITLAERMLDSKDGLCPKESAVC
jgi:hypothetical protein